MPETRMTPVKARAGSEHDFNDRVDRCLAMVLHHAEVQDIAAIVKKVYAERLQEKGECKQNQ